MKYYYVLLTLLIGITLSHSQAELQGEWFLHYIETGDLAFFQPNIYNNDFKINFTQESGANGQIFEGFATCNAYFGEYTATNTYITIADFAHTLQDCDFNDNYFEGTYFLIFSNTIGLNFEYIVTGDSQEGSLTLLSPNGDYLKYGRQPLPIPDISGIWYLHSIFDTDLEFTNEFNPNAFIEFTTDKNGTTIFSGTAMCNEFSGNYLTALTPSIAISGFGFTDLDCNNDDANYFESLYLPMFYSNESDESLIYTQVSNDESDAQLHLYSINNGVWAYFGREPLTNSEFVKTELSLMKNPATSYLEINGLSQFNLNYNIYSIEGKTMQEGILNTNIINVQALTNGFYFLKINNTQIIKFIKR